MRSCGRFSKVTSEYDALRNFGDSGPGMGHGRTIRGWPPRFSFLVVTVSVGRRWLSGTYAAHDLK